MNLVGASERGFGDFGEADVLDLAFPDGGSGRIKMRKSADHKEIDAHFLSSTSASIVFSIGVTASTR